MSDLMNAAFRAAIALPPPCDLTYSALAECYGTSRQSIIQLGRTHNLDKDHLAVPGIVSAALTHFGRDSPLRRRLQTPGERKRIETAIAERTAARVPEIELAAIRGNVPPTIEAKIQTIS